MPSVSTTVAPSQYQSGRATALCQYKGGHALLIATPPCARTRGAHMLRVEGLRCYAERAKMLRNEGLGAYQDFADSYH
eukprot:3650121-Rhodomonas_salina.2